MSQIRYAYPSDHDAAMRLWREGGLGEMTEAEWHAVIESPTSVLLVAEEDGEVVGTVVAAFDGWRAYISHVAVAAAHRGHGIAKALMGEAEGQLARVGARRAFVTVHQENPPGLALAAVMGYELEGEVVAVKELAEEPPQATA